MFSSTLLQLSCSVPPSPPPTFFSAQEKATQTATVRVPENSFVDNVVEIELTKSHSMPVGMPRTLNLPWPVVTGGFEVDVESMGAYASPPDGYDMERVEEVMTITLPKATVRE